MNTIQLECFLAVSENLNFARAAEQLHITQPAVTHQIHSLETELNTRLFVRTTRSVELTPAGFAFISDASDILGRTRAAKARFSGGTPGQISELFIGCLGLPEQNLIPPVLRNLKKDFPQLHPIIRQAPLPLMQNQILEETIHVLFGFAEETERIGEPFPVFSKKTGIFAILAKTPVSCILSPEHPLASRESLSFHDLKELSILACEPRHTPAVISSAIAPLIGQRSLENIYFCDNLSSIFILAKAGLGFSLVPDIPGQRDPGLSYIPMENIPPLQFGLYYKNLSTHPALKRFIELMQEEFK